MWCWQRGKKTEKIPGGRAGVGQGEPWQLDVAKMTSSWQRGTACTGDYSHPCGLGLINQTLVLEKEELARIRLGPVLHGVEAWVGNITRT